MQLQEIEFEWFKLHKMMQNTIKYPKVVHLSYALHCKNLFLFIYFLVYKIVYSVLEYISEGKIISFSTSKFYL